MSLKIRYGGCDLFFSAHLGQPAVVSSNYLPGKVQDNI